MCLIWLNCFNIFCNCLFLISLYLMIVKFLNFFLVKCLVVIIEIVVVCILLIKFVFIIVIG